MRTILISLLLLALACPAFATERLKDKLIAEGDSAGSVLAKVGEPDRIVQIQNKYGATVAERWVYIIKGYNPKIVTIVVSGGKVVSIDSELQ